MKTKAAIRHVLLHDKNTNNVKLAEAIGCTHTTIANWLKGKGSMNNTVYKRFKVIYPTIEIDDIRNNDQGGAKAGRGKIGELTYE